MFGNVEYVGRVKPVRVERPVRKWSVTCEWSDPDGRIRTETLRCVGTDEGRVVHWLRDMSRLRHPGCKVILYGFTEVER